MAEGGRRGLSREALLVSLLALQAMLLLFVLAYFAATQDPVRMPLEARPLDEEVEPHLAASEILDKVSLLSGPEFLGVAFPTEFRRGLNFESGQFMWFLLDRRLEAGDGFLARAKDVMDPEEFEKLREGVTGGVLSFVYDLGGHRDLFAANWRAVPVRELQASPLLPWDKRLDFLVLSSLSEGSVGGLPFITSLNQGVPLVMPPHDPQRLRDLRAFSRKPNAIVLPEGLHPLGAGLWALVMRVPPERGVPDGHELDLLVETGSGDLYLFAGSGLNRPLDALREARRLTGRAPAMYIGSTGYEVGWDTGAVQDELVTLAEEFPALVMMPNGSTSMVGHGAVEGILGERYRPGRLGTRIAL